MEKILKTLKALLAWFGVLILLPFVLLAVGSLCIWKYVIVHIFVKLFKRKFIQGLHEYEAIFAVDRYWENSNSSKSCLGLVLEVEGDINVETLREKFRKNVLDLELKDEHTDSPKPKKPFERLVQIPSTFGGYYFWQKANYFLIHEHIRQISQPTDQHTLKKAVSTLMTLPFPNRRPLWEILVFSKYSGTTAVGNETNRRSCVLFIRIHRAVTDNQGLFNILRCMLDKDIIVPPKVAFAEMYKGETKVDNEDGRVSLAFKNLTNLIYLPLRVLQTLSDILKKPTGITSVDKSSASSDSVSASWSTLSELTVQKVCSTQLSSHCTQTVELAILLESMASHSIHKCSTVREEKGATDSEGSCQKRILISQPNNECPIRRFPTNSRFFSVKCPCISSFTSVKTSFLETLNTQLTAGLLNEGEYRHMYRVWLKLITLLPRHVLRYLLMTKKWSANFIIYELFPAYNDMDNMDADMYKLFGLQQVNQIIPLVGLQWPYTAASAATLKWKGNFVMSLVVVNANVEVCDSLAPDVLNNLGKDMEDQGFVTIPIS